MALAGISEPWLHPGANKPKAEELLSTLDNRSGVFLVRKHKDPAKFVLSVGYKGKPTHHLGEVKDNNIWLNNRQISGCSTVVELITKLKSEKVEGWPIPLTDFPENQSSSSQPSTSNRSRSSLHNYAEILVTVNRGEDGFGMTLTNKGHGTFVMKNKPGGAAESAFNKQKVDVSLGLRLKSVNGEDVWDLPKKNATGIMKMAKSIDLVFIVDEVGFKATIDAQSNPSTPRGSTRGTPATSPSTPVSSPINENEATEPNTDQQNLSPTSPSHAPEETVPPYEQKDGGDEQQQQQQQQQQEQPQDQQPQDRPKRPGPVIGYPLWLHENNLSRSQADALLTQAGLEEGLFLVRRKNDVTFAIDFSSNGKLSHHLVKPLPGSDQLCIHDDPTLVADTLNEVVESIQDSKGEHWPVGLQTFVPNTKRPSDPPFTGENFKAYIAAGSPSASPGGNDSDDGLIVETISKPLDGMITDLTHGEYVTMEPNLPAVREKGARLASPDELMEANKGVMINPQRSPKREVLPAVESARKDLHDAVQVLSALRQDKLHEALAKYVNRKWTTSDLVVVVDQICEHLEEADRNNVLEKLARILPISQQTPFRTMFKRIKIERDFDEVIERTPLELHAELARLVAGVLKRVRSDTRKPEEISSFERRVQLASAQRGFAVVTMQGERKDEPFVLEEIAKGVHVGWARSVISSWAPEYGMEPLGELIYTKEGALDTFNFTSVQGLQIYQQRVALANQRYVLPNDTDVSTELQVPESQKHLYRITAEILLDCYLKLHPQYSKRPVQRQDRFAYVELKQLGLIGKPVKNKAPPPPSPVHSTFASGKSLTGRGGGVNVRIALPPASNSLDGVEQQQQQQQEDPPPPWYHGIMEKTQAQQLLARERDGTFLVRERPNLPGHALDFKYQGKTTHHLITPTDDGATLLIGGTEVVEGAHTIEELIAGLYLPQQSWPLPLKAFVPRPGSASKDVVETQKRLAAQSQTIAAEEVDWEQTKTTFLGESFQLTIVKGDKPLGLSLVGKGDDNDEREGVFVTKIKPGSPAAETGQITPGLRIVAINGADLTDATKGKVMEYLKVEAGTEIEFTFQNDRSGFTKFQAVTKQQKEGTKADVYGIPQPFDNGQQPPEIPGRQKGTDIPSTNSNPPHVQEESPGSNDVQVTIKKDGSFGMAILNLGHGNFVARVNDGGPAAKEFGSKGISVDKGIRIVSINGTDLFDQPKAECMSIMKSVDELNMVVRLDTDAWAATEAAREAKLSEKESQQKTSSSALEAGNESNKTVAEFSPKTGSQLSATDVGARVRVEGYDCEGTIRFFGPHATAEGNPLRVGVELDEPVGKNSGTVKGHQYFKCAAKHGCLVKPAKVTTIPDGSSVGNADNVPTATNDQISRQPNVIGSDSDQIHVQFVKGNAAGFGISLANQGAGTFVSSIKPGGVGEKALSGQGLQLSDGLRFVSVNGIDVENGSKSECAAQMKGKSTVDIVFKRDPEGYSAIKAAKENKSGRPSDATPKSSNPNEVSVSIVKGAGGFGMKLGNSGQGTFVTLIKQGGAAEAALSPLGISVADGLRIKSINGIDVFDALKSATVGQMKGQDVVNVVFVKDKAGYANVSGANKGDGGKNATTTPTSSSVNDSEMGASDFDNMGRLAIIKHLRNAGIDYSAAKNLESLRALAKQSQVGQKNEKPSGKKKKEPRQTHSADVTYDVPTQPTNTKSSDSQSDYDNMGRLAIIKLLRSNNIDYSQAKSVEELRALAKSQLGNNGGSNVSLSKKKGKKSKTKIGTKWNTQLQRNAAEQILNSNNVEGGFVVRPSTRSSSGLSLSVFQQGKVTNFNILLEGGKLKLASSPLSFSKIEQLIQHYVDDADGAFACNLVVLPQFQ